MAKLDELRKINEMISKGYILASVKSLNKYYGVMPEELFYEQSKAIMAGCSKMFIHGNVLAEMDKKLQEYKDYNKKLAKTAQLNNKGKEYEKAGKIKQAISTYEKNIELGYPASHAFSRLMVIYRKSKDFDNEIRIIEKAIDVFGIDTRYDADVLKWLERLKKVEQLRNK